MMRLLCSVTLSCLTSFAYGFHVAIISVLFLSTLATRELLSAVLYLKEEFPVLGAKPGLLSLLVSSPLIGALLGSFLFPRLSQSLGRRPALFNIHCLFILASILQSCSTALWPLYLARTLLGLAVGGTTSIVPMYISELSPSSIRGRLGTANQFSISSGIFTSYLVGYGCSFMSENQWRLMFALPAIISLMYVCLHFLTLESPRWLISKGRLDEAAQVWIHCVQGSAGGEELTVAVVNTNGRRSRGGGVGWFQMLKSCKRELSIAIAVNVFQQFSGFNILVYFAGLIFQELGFNVRDSLLASALSSLPQLLFLIVSAYCLDRFGRIPLFTLSSLALMLFFALLAFEPSLNPTASVKILLVLGARISFSLGLGPIPAIICSEILPNEVREKGMALASFSNWLANIIVTMTFLEFSRFLDSVLPKGVRWSFLVHSIILLFMAAFTQIFIPETKGTTLRSLTIVSDNAENRDDEEEPLTTSDEETPILL